MVIYLQLVLAMLFYGVSFVSTKVALAELGPLHILAIRLVLSSAFLVALDHLRANRPENDATLRWPRRADLGSLVVVALFQPLLYFIAENVGLQYVSASIASIIIATIPVFTPVVAGPLLGERLRPVAIAGLLLSLAGVAVIVLERNLQAQYTAGGLALVFVAVFAAVGYSVAVKRVSSRYRPLSIVKLQNLIGLPVVVVLAFVLEGVPTGVPHPTVLGHLLYLALFPSSLAFIFLSTGIRRIGASRANVFVNLVPAFTAIVAWLVLGERFTAQKLLGMVVVVAGVLTSQLGSRRPRAQTTAGQ